MSKNTDLFLNLCKFMKYFITDILPDNEPTDSLKETTEDLLVALTKFSIKIGCKITPILNENENAIQDNFSQMNGFVSEHEDEKENDAVSPSSYLLSEEKMSSYSSGSEDVTKSEDSSNSAIKKKQGPQPSNNQDSILPKQLSLKIVAAEQIKLRENVQLNDKVLDNYLYLVDKIKFLDFCQVKKPWVTKEYDIAHKIMNMNLGDERDDLVSYEMFKELNICMKAKLVKQGLFCFPCALSMDTADQLKTHKYFHQFTSQSDSDDFVFANLCEKCVLYIVSNKSSLKELSKIHVEYHETVNENESSLKAKTIENKEIEFLGCSLHSKHKRDNVLSTFHGICLFCFFEVKQPLEWSSHIEEFHEVLSPEMTLFNCPKCCLFILGSGNVNYLALPQHVSYCS